MLARTLALLFCMLLSSGTLMGQAPYPPRKEVTEMLQDLDYAFRRVAEATEQINFGEWKAPYERIRSTQELLGKQLELLKRSQRLARKIEETIGPVSSVDLFLLQGSTTVTFEFLSTLEERQLNYGKIDTASSQVSAALEVLHKTRLKLDNLLLRQISAQEQELRTCKRN